MMILTADGHMLQISRRVPDSHSWMGEPCTSLIKSHRNRLENDIYANGVENVRRVLCTEITNICVPHNIIDHGEL